MMQVESTFPTFCHISEYGEDGYRNLHRILAFSAPLNLWAPSSVLIRSVSRIEPKVFIRYVERGLIRIHGRENWLTDRQFRNKHRWSAAAWDSEIDDALDAMRREDQNVRDGMQRVVVAPPEEGFKRAAEYLDRHPEQVARWNRIFRSRSARSKIPAGTWESASRYQSDGPTAVAVAILRDAYNHGLAIRDSGADAPLLLGSADRQFLNLLEGSWGPDGREGSSPQQSTLEGELASQLVEVLRCLDIHRGSMDVERFMKGGGRRALVAWLHDVCQRYREVNPREVDNIVINELRSQVAKGKFARPLGELLVHPITTTVGLVALVSTAVGFVQEPANVLAGVGMAASVVQVAGGAAKQFGIAPSSYTGPQWPVLYSCAGQVRPRYVRKLRYVLEEFASS
jgi:hypothetical protein